VEKTGYQSQIKACELLLINGAKIDIKDKNGKTVLDWQRSCHPETENGRQYQKEMLVLYKYYYLINDCY
jgi:hypothetical protein